MKEILILSLLVCLCSAQSWTYNITTSVYLLYTINGVAPVNNSIQIDLFGNDTNKTATNFLTICLNSVGGTKSKNSSHSILTI